MLKSAYLDYSFLSKITCFILLVLLSFSSKGQRDNYSGKTGGADRQPITFNGYVLDAQTDAALEFATVSFFSLKDSSLISGGLTDVNGEYSVQLKSPKVYMVAEYISYESYVLNPVPVDFKQIKEGNRKVEIETIYLKPANYDLGEVEIVAEKSETQFSLDKTVFNVSKDNTTRGSTAEEVLDNVPSVTVDIEGQVSLRGSTGVRILVDGKPSNLANSENANSLRSIPANMIEKVEVITNPSARYEAEGMAGIINIVLKKEKRSGFNGSFDLVGGLPEIAGFGANLNYRKGKINWFANYGLSWRKLPGGGFVNQESDINDTLFITDQTRDMRRGGLSNSVRAGVDYFFDEKSSLTGALQFKISDEDNTSDLVYTDYLFSRDNEPYLISERYDVEFEDESSLQYSLNYRKEFSSRDHYLNVLAQYEDELETEGSDFTELIGVQDGYLTQTLKQRANNTEGQKEWLFQTDYNHNLNKDHKYELGIRASLRQIGNDYLIEEFANDEWFVLTNISNTFEYDENIYAAYAQYGNKIKKFGYLAGIRGEYSDVTTELLQTNEINPRDYFNLFPSLFLSWEFNPANAIQLSYSRRITRPRFWDLNPFFTFSDNRNYFGGNPNLDPEFTDSYELNYLLIREKLTFTSGIFYRYTTDVIVRLTTLNDDGTTNTMPQNLSTRDDSGVALTLSYSALKWLRLNGDFNVFQSITNGENIETDFISDNITYTSTGSARFSFWDSDLQLRLRYRGPRVTPQARYRSMTMLNVGWSKDLLPSKDLTLTLSFNDIFNQRRRRYETFGEDFYRIGEFQFRSRTATATLSYRVNQKNKRGGRGNRSGGSYSGGDGGF